MPLVREPENKFDINAIALFWNGECVGYIPKDIAVILAPIIDENDLDLFAEVLYNAYLHDNTKLDCLFGWEFQMI